jgi:hypothetical protein
MADYKYEVAFSFLKEDEAIALKINDLLQDRMTTFIYSKRQEEVAGTDGEETFNKVFGEESRIVVVLYRENWGQTPWTRIEETAIRNRAYNDGYDFTIFIPLNNPPSVPKWLPKTHIWTNIARYGTDGAANIIETKVQQSAGTTREENLEERALRIKREIEFQNEKDKFLYSAQGVKAANEEIQKLFKQMIIQIESISNKTHITFRVEKKEDGDHHWVDIFSETHSVSVDWYYSFSNSLENSRLTVELWKPGKPRPDRYYSKLTQRAMVKSTTFNFDYDESKNYKWKGDKHYFSVIQLAEYCIRLLIDHLNKKGEPTISDFSL